MSIEKRGDRYLARVSRQVDGKQEQFAKRFRLKKDAERWEREQRGKVERAEWVQPSKQTLNAYLDGWLAGPMGANQRTRDDYRRILASYIRPALGTVRLDQLTTTMIRTALAELSARGLSPRTVHYAHSVLRLALGHAVEDRLLIVNPAVAKRMLPPATRHEVAVLSRADVRRLLEATRDTRLGALWNLLAYTGMRPGEALGLQWADVDLSAGGVRVRRGLVPQKKDSATGRTWRLEEPKTEKSRRAIPLLPATVVALRWHRTGQDAEKIAAGSAYSDYGFVFASPTGEPLREDVVYKSHFRPALRAAGVPAITLYALRHTAATLMLEAGIAMKVVQERLGHSTMMLTADTYSHVSASLQARAVEDLTRYMETAE
ncbi:MAG: tyrosine-type recombinase/integrase [Gemmatimonadales bacterium]|nr:tyrosine-type recombinase/integrase [Gemmatimonadales bacterium]